MTAIPDLTHPTVSLSSLLLPSSTEQGQASSSSFLCSGLVFQYAVRQIFVLSLVHLRLNPWVVIKNNLLTENLLYCTLAHSSHIMSFDLHSNLHSRHPDSYMVKSLIMAVSYQLTSSVLSWVLHIRAAVQSSDRQLFVKIEFDNIFGFTLNFCLVLVSYNGGFIRFYFMHLYFISVYFSFTFSNFS